MAIELDPDLVQNAADGNSAALTEVLAACYPSICRIAVAVTGDTRRGLAIVKDLVGKSMKAAKKWEDSAAPWRWFVHHAILNARPSRATVNDPLLSPPVDTHLPYMAFVKALRNLPPQQVEAFILHHGERLGTRELAIAMDCSTAAAGNHLAAAEQAVKQVSAEKYDRRLGEFRSAYDRLSPDPEAVKLYLADRVRAYVVPRQAVRWVGRAVIALLIAGACYAAWRAFKFMSN